MLKRPCSRRKSASGGITLNLVPILDTMVTLIGFLLFTTSFLSIVNIESPFPQASTQKNEEAIKDKPLQLTVSIRATETEIWSPFEKIAPRKIPNDELGQPDLKLIHESLLEVKKQFPEEQKIVMVPNSATNYDTLVSVMDILRTIEPTDPPIFHRNEQTGVDEAIKKLFPEVIFGNLLGDS